jgi:predicted RNase H-like HicB family nuclease
MKYTIILEKGETSYGAYAPDIPGCVAVGETKEETLILIKEAIEFHIEGLKEDGQRIPFPHHSSETVEVSTV